MFLFPPPRVRQCAMVCQERKGRGNSRGEQEISQGPGKEGGTGPSPGDEGVPGDQEEEGGDGGWSRGRDSGSGDISWWSGEPALE